VNTDKALKMLGVKSLKGIDWRGKREMLLEKYRENPERAMLCLAYCYGDDGEYSNYHSAESWNDYIIVHKKNDKLDALYDFLIALGYEMSDEEQQLRDGTHPLFDQPKAPAGVPAEPVTVVRSGDSDESEDSADPDEIEDNAADGVGDDYFDEPDGDGE
jgi:hypothetical protein